MIDTISFLIPYSNDLVNAIYRKGGEVHVKYNSVLPCKTYKYIKGTNRLGSYNRDVNLFITKSKIKLELSLPKYVFGHNVFLLYPQEVEEVIFTLWSELSRLYDIVFPFPETWKINRLDICYNWKFPSDKDAMPTLRAIKLYTYPYKKNKKVYPTSVMFYGGKMHSIKFYLKYPEYYKRDFNKLKNNPQTNKLAYELLSYSTGVLRFEVTLRGYYLSKKFPQYQNRYHIATQYDTICSELKNFLDNVLKSQNKTYMTIENAKSKLESVYKKQRSNILLHYWLDKNTRSKQLLDLLYDYHRSTISRYNNYLNKANLGILTESEYDFDINIPSFMVTNPPLLACQAVDDTQGATY